MIIDGMSMEMEMFLESFSRWSLFGKLLFAGSQKFFAILHYCFLWWICKRHLWFFWWIGTGKSSENGDDWNWWRIIFLQNVVKCQTNVLLVWILQDVHSQLETIPFTSVRCSYKNDSFPSTNLKTNEVQEIQNINGERPLREESPFIGLPCMRIPIKK